MLIIEYLKNMSLKNKINIKYYKNFLVLFLVLFFAFSFFQTNTQADELDDLIDQYCESVSEEECEDYKKEVKSQEKEFDSLENQLKNAEKLLKLKEQQSLTLQNQIQILDSEIGSVQGDINSLENEILNLEEKIKRIITDIEKKDKNITENQKNLSEMLRLYHKLNKELGLTVLSRDSSLTNLFSQSDYLSKLSDNINNTLKLIKEEKEILKKNREELEIEKGKVDNKKSELDDERLSLSLKKNERNNILRRTKGEEAEYQKLIANIESQMKQLLIDVNSLSAADQRELNDILKDAKKPKEGLASTSWHYYQTDSRWKNERLGGSRYTIGDSGCAISSIAMVFTYHKEKVDPEDLADVSSFTSQGYINWDSTTKEFDMELIKKTGHSSSNFSSSSIKDYLEEDLPVIVYISAGGPGHYVVIHGYDSERKDFVVHDPYWGPNLLLDTSKRLVSKLHGRSVVVDQVIVYE